ncbi:MAG: hypothetical protein M1823_000992 [Watsoniomyces obsoletus]|nr:MAG: hypothetical protein M1823_000992 [Watsoniomyces obsoletus]
MAEEHTTLSKAVTTDDFNARVAKRIGELSAVANAFREWKEASNAFQELEALLQDPSTDDELRTLASGEIKSSTKDLTRATNTLTTALIPKHPFADLPCLLEIRPGAGGGEAALFAGDLLRMYRSYCSRRRFRVSLLKLEHATASTGSGGSSSSSGGAEVPLQEAILEIDTVGAYGELRCEAGVHRVQRIPATEAKGRTHTSAASVMVLPSIPNLKGSSGGDDGTTSHDWEDPSSDYYIDPKEVRTDVMRARGAGGQHVNTTDSAVRLTHLPTNTVVSMQDFRSQPKNREKAWLLMRSKLAQARRDAREDEALRLRRGIIGAAQMGRGDKIRTYNWSQQRVTDHRSGVSVHDLDDVLGGGEALEKVMRSVRTWLAERDMDSLLVDDDGIK